MSRDELHGFGKMNGRILKIRWANADKRFGVLKKLRRIKMNWKLFLKPTLGKVLLLALFLLIPLPFPRETTELFNAKYAPIVLLPFLKTSTIWAYVILALIALCFYILACLVSNLYHRFVLVPPVKRKK
ncbi:MAG: hypothetical protein AABX01_01230 [Candidatus Micrarchaeota archaeon]|mgnify:CR=1 FL=1